MPSSTTASQTELRDKKVPLQWRDNCSALLLPLNVCRKDKLYLPWECEHEKHAYEKCQYDDYMRRMTLLSKRKLASAEEE